MRCEECLYYAQLPKYCGIQFTIEFCSLGPWSCNTLSAFQLLSISDYLVKSVQTFLLFGYGVCGSVCVLAVSEYAGILYFNFKNNLRFGKKEFFFFNLKGRELFCQRVVDICGSNVVFPQFKELYWFYKIKILHYYKHSVLVLEIHICSIVVTSLLFRAIVILGYFNVTYFNIFFCFYSLTNKKHFVERNFSKMCK